VRDLETALVLEPGVDLFRVEPLIQGDAPIAGVQLEPPRPIRPLRPPSRQGTLTGEGCAHEIGEIGDEESHFNDVGRRAGARGVERASDHAARLKVGDERGRRSADFRYRERASAGERCREPRVWDDESEAKRRYDLELKPSISRDRVPVMTQLKRALVQHDRFSRGWKRIRRWSGCRGIVGHAEMIARRSPKSERPVLTHIGWPQICVCCRFSQQSADTKRTHEKRHARRPATHPRLPDHVDLQEKPCRG
jgi:hypothetical protein